VGRRLAGPEQDAFAELPADAEPGLDDPGEHEDANRLRSEFFGSGILCIELVERGLRFARELGRAGGHGMLRQCEGHGGGQRGRDRECVEEGWHGISFLAASGSVVLLVHPRDSTYDSHPFHRAPGSPRES
jgi:hypothetical protein